MRKLLSLTFVVALIALVITLETRRQEAQKQLEQLTIRLEQLQGNSSQNREAAKSIIQKVQKHMAISMEVEPTVATIVNVEELRKKNSFYNKAENGDHLVVTTMTSFLMSYRCSSSLLLLQRRLLQPSRSILFDCGTGISSSLSGIFRVGA
jgi:hypothetical protein